MELLAPNGQPSNLTPEQYKLVRSPEFISWFGDWINSPETASKVVDENGEPLVVYHGTNKKFNIFKESKYKDWYFFTADIEEAKNFAENVGGSVIIQTFLNCRNPNPKKTNLQIAINKNLLPKEYDCHFQGGWDTSNFRIVVVKNSNQIKLADGTNTTFDANNPDIRYADGGGLSKTPAPKSERIYGSKTNKPKSSASSSSAKSINFSEDTLQKIKNNIAKHNENYPNKKITLPVAKAVVRRGMGAYSSTHRPTISGGKPNSRVAWGLARLNAFAYKIINGKSKSGKYNQDDDLIKELHVYRYGGTTESWQYSIGGL